MKQVVKIIDSQITRDGLRYTNGNNSLLTVLLQGEQRDFCAYTEKQFNATDLIEIDHFDPSLKGTENDGYNNWYVVVAKWNRKKARKWEDYQPILHPTNEDFSTRIWFESGVFQYHPEDVEAKNLVSLLGINNYELTIERQRYLDRMLDLREMLGNESFCDHLLKYPE
jgi:hypothetical protein